MAKYFRNDLINRQVAPINVPKKELMMCLNESSLDPYRAVKESFDQLMQEVHLNRYFAKESRMLQTELAAYAGVGTDELLYGNGADDMLYTMFLSVREKNDDYVLTLRPSYFDYTTYAKAVGMQIKYHDLDNCFDFDEVAYLKKAKNEKCKLLILCNPNNPTGNLQTSEKIEYILENLPDKLVIIDETYFEFSGVSYAKKLKKYDNLVIVRSFSKGFSCAGLRFGYILSSKQNIGEIKKCRMYFHSSIFTQVMALAILRNKEIFLNHNREVIKWRNELYDAMVKITGLEVTNTHTNFLIFSMGCRTEQLFELISANDIAVRNIHGSIPQHLRVTVSEPAHNQKFLGVIKKGASQS